MNRVALLFALASLSGCFVPALRGASVESEHCSLRTDQPDRAFARQVSDEAERIHAVLRGYFGGSPSKLPILTITDWETYSAMREFDVSAGEYHYSWFVSPSYVINAWSSPLTGRKGMAHELVHHFVFELADDIPLWMNEGLAEALEHSSKPLVTERLVSGGEAIGVRSEQADPFGCPLTRGLGVAVLSPDALEKRVERLLAYEGGWDGPLVDSNLRLLSALVMRFGMETAGRRDLREAVGWRLDVGAFQAWLRTNPRAHTRFPPLLDGGDARGQAFAAKEVPFAYPKLGGWSGESRGFLLHAEARLSVVYAAAVIEHAWPRLEAWFPGLEPEPVRLFLCAGPGSFEAHRYTERSASALTRLSGWQWVDLPSVEPFGIVRGGPQLAPQIVGALVNRALAKCFTGDVPQWILAGLVKALDHGASRCPAEAVGGWSRERVAAELERLHQPMRDQTHLAFAGLVVRYGLETQSWTDLAKLATWTPDADGLAQWMDETDLSSFDAMHTAFRPLLTR